MKASVNFVKIINKTGLILIISIYFILQSADCFSQSGTAINATGASSDPSAILDVSSTTQGILIPRVALTDTALAAPVTNPANSLLVYAGNAVGNGITPGFYYWDAAKTQWVKLATGTPTGGSGNGWQLTGDAGTNAAVNFIGTTDAQDMVIKSNNIEGVRVQTNGNVRVNKQFYTPKYTIP